MSRMMTRSLASVAAGAAFVATSFVGVAAAETPRPGCGYGDDNHSHQAAPGQDPNNLRPGKGPAGGHANTDFTHTAPPGQAPDGAGVAGDPARGCNDDPR